MTKTFPSLEKNRIKVLLLEGLHPLAIDRMTEEGYVVEAHNRAFDEEELLEAIPNVHVLGIRSKTLITEKILERAENLLAVGAFCIGTNQVDIDAACERAVPVFNAPYSNTRSVAELVIAEIIMLFRGLFDKIRQAHGGRWKKSAQGSEEVRNKTLGIVGYGHIGRQVSVLAEALGMRVLYYDIIDRLSMGNATPVMELRDLLEQSDLVTLHVPGTRDTEGMMGRREFGYMRDGAHFINASRGSVVDMEALREALTSGKLAGAAVDVFPEEPKSKEDPFITPIQNLPNVILTPHIGGATQEAQRNIGLEVAGKLIRFTNLGSTEGAVNFPNEVLADLRGHHRILHVHQNVPGVLQQVNAIFAEANINIAAQTLRNHGEVGYLIVDINHVVDPEMVARIGAMPETIRVRVLG